MAKYKIIAYGDEDCGTSTVTTTVSAINRDYAFRLALEMFPEHEDFRITEVDKDD